MLFFWLVIFSLCGFLRSHRSSALPENDFALQKEVAEREIIHLSSATSSQDVRPEAFTSDIELNKGEARQSEIEEAMLSRPRLFFFHNLPEKIKSEACILCLTPFSEVKDDESFKIIFKTSCGHFFHLKCLDTWKQNGRSTCPTCQVALEKQANSDDEVIDINFETITLASLIKLLAEKKGFNYVINKELNNIKVSLKTYRPTTIDGAWQIMLTLLDMHDFTHVITGALHKFMPKKEGATEAYPLFSSSKGVTPDMLPDSDQIIRYIYFLKNITTEMANSILSVLLGEKPMMVGDLNVLIIRDNARTIKQAMRIIEELDIGGMRQSMSTLYLKHTDATTVASFLSDELLSNKNTNDRIRFFSPFKKNMKYFASDVRIIASKDRNALIFLGQQSDIDRIIHFIKLAIDVEIGEAKSRVHIKEIKYHSPDAIKNILQKVMKASSPNQNYFKDVVIFSETPQQSSYGGSGSNNLGAGNRLVVSCGNDDWRRISEFIDRIDKPQPTLAIEIMIVDASLRMQRQLDVHIRDAKDGFINSSVSFREAVAYETSAGARENSLQVGFVPNMSAVTFGAPNTLNGANNAWALIRSLVADSNSTIIYQPFLVTKNNQATHWNNTSSQQAPGELAQSGTNTIRRQTSLNVETTVDVTPRINYAGMINLELNITVGEFSIGQDIPDRNSRTLKTSAQLGLGEVLALGGFHKSKLTSKLYRVPILSSIPIIGNLFKSRDKDSTKTQLYIFIRLSAIKQQLYADPDDYTELKIKYAKYQVDNINNYAQTRDPFERYFFKPRNLTIEQTMSDYNNQRFHYIDDFVEGKNMPIATNMINDPYYNATGLEASQQSLESYRKHKSTSDQKRLPLKTRSKPKSDVVVVKEIKVVDASQQNPPSPKINK